MWVTSKFGRCPIDIARPLLAGSVPSNIVLHLAVLLAYALVAYTIALLLIRRRLLG